MTLSEDFLMLQEGYLGTFADKESSQDYQSQKQYGCV